jgi:hypothetical protein
MAGAPGRAMAAPADALIAPALRADAAAVRMGRTDGIRAVLGIALPLARGAAAALLTG